MSVCPQTKLGFLFSSPKTSKKMLMIITTIMIMIIIPIMLFITWFSCRRVNNLVPASLQRVSCVVSKKLLLKMTVAMVTIHPNDCKEDDLGMKLHH